MERRAAVMDEKYAYEGEVRHLTLGLVCLIL